MGLVYLVANMSLLDQLKLSRAEWVLVGVFAALFCVWLVRSCTADRSVQPCPDIEQVAAPSDQNSVVALAYAQVDSLKVRALPNLNAAVVDYLLLDESVRYSGERSARTQSIRLNGREQIEPWVKVTTRRDKSGWVFGGGLRFYTRD